MRGCRKLVCCPNIVSMLQFYTKKVITSYFYFPVRGFRKLVCCSNSFPLPPPVVLILPTVLPVKECQTLLLLCCPPNPTIPPPSWSSQYHLGSTCEGMWKACLLSPKPHLLPSVASLLLTVLQDKGHHSLLLFCQ